MGSTVTEENDVLLIISNIESILDQGDSIENVDMKIDSIKTELNKVKSLFQ